MWMFFATVVLWYLKINSLPNIYCCKHYRRGADIICHS